MDLREGKDLDYIHTKSAPLIKVNDDIQSHNSYGIGRYELNYDEIIHNPVNHFYSRGVKFVSPIHNKRYERKEERTKRY